MKFLGIDLIGIFRGRTQPSTTSYRPQPTPVAQPVQTVTTVAPDFYIKTTADGKRYHGKRGPNGRFVK